VRVAVVRVAGDFNLRVPREAGAPGGFSESSINPSPDSAGSTR
jgi:hypothetical protein